MCILLSAVPFLDTRSNAGFQTRTVMRSTRSNYTEALASEDWCAADGRELQEIYKRRGVDDTDISEVPAGHQILPCIMHRNIKLGV